MKSPGRTYDFEKNRVVTWISAGATSAVCGKIIQQDKRIPRENKRFVYCDTGSEHPTNGQFLKDCESWYDHPIEIIKNPDYNDIWEVFEKRKFLVGPRGAQCTTLLKKKMRQSFEQFDDIQVFGFDSGEVQRAKDFIEQNQEVKLYAPLIEKSLSKGDCLGYLLDQGIKLPAMYGPQKSGAPYGHNNCIGCVKGGMGYWNKIRIDFPETFDRMAKMERKIGHSICKEGEKGEIPVYLDQLQPGRGNFEKEPNMVCDMLCRLEMDVSDC